MSSSTRTTNRQERRGEVLKVARELLADGRSEDLLSLVTQLVEQNHQLTTRAAELEKQLERIQARYKRSEAVWKAQLVLLLDAIARGEASDVLGAEDDPRPDANERLRDASGIAESQDNEPKTQAPRDRPARRQHGIERGGGVEVDHRRGRCRRGGWGWSWRVGVGAGACAVVAPSHAACVARHAAAKIR